METKQTIKKISVLVLGGFIASSQSPVLAADSQPDVVIRNALTTPVQMEFTDSRFSHIRHKSTVQARWEVRVSHANVGNMLDLGVRVLDPHSSQKRQEIARCQSTLPATTQASKVVVIVYVQEGAPHCSIIDLNTILSASSSEPRTTTASNRI